MNVKDIVIEYLKKNGFDGLCGAGCWCGLEDALMPCDVNAAFECEPAIKVKPDCEKCENKCEVYGEADYCFKVTDSISRFTCTSEPSQTIDIQLKLCKLHSECTAINKGHAGCYSTGPCFQ